MRNVCAIFKNSVFFCFSTLTHDRPASSAWQMIYTKPAVKVLHIYIYIHESGRHGAIDCRICPKEAPLWRMTFAWWFHKSSSDQTAFLQSQCVERERESQPWLLRNLQSVIEEANVRIVKLQPEAWLLDNPCTNNCQHG